MDVFAIPSTGEIIDVGRKWITTEPSDTLDNHRIMF